MKSSVCVWSTELNEYDKDKMGGSSSWLGTTLYTKVVQQYIDKGGKWDSNLEYTKGGRS